MTSSNWKDSKRLDWLGGRQFTAYRSRDAETGELLGHVTVVDEDAKGSRVGRVATTLRGAIDKAMAASKTGSEAPDALLEEEEGWGVAIRREDGSFFLACASPGVLPAIWPRSQRAQAVKHRRELNSEGFTAAVVPVAFCRPALTEDPSRWFGPSDNSNTEEECP